MATKVISIGTFKDDSIVSNYTFRDVSLTALPSVNEGSYLDVQPVYLSDYFKYICTENSPSAIMTEQSIQNSLEIDDIMDSAKYLKYIDEKLSNYPSIIRESLTKIALKLAENNDNSQCLTDDELNQYMTYYDPEYFGTADQIGNPLSVIAVQTKAGYEDAVRRYKLHIQKSKYRVGNIDDVQAINNSLNNIFNWTQGERILEPEFGTRLRVLLYNGITEDTTEQIISEIRNAVSTWEPRVRIESIDNMTTIEDVENNTVRIRIIYTIVALTNSPRYSFTYEYQNDTI